MKNHQKDFKLPTVVAKTLELSTRMNHHETKGKKFPSRY